MKIRILHQGLIYGPIEGPCTFETALFYLRVSKRAHPTLSRYDAPNQVITDPNAVLTTGFYNLVADPTVLFDSSVDKIPPKALPVVRIKASHSTETQTEPMVFTAPPNESKQTFPLSKVEMTECIDQMLHLISTIPPRYTKYNKVLSQQIKVALEESEKLISECDDIFRGLTLHSLGHLHESGVTVQVYLTFVQYRILHILHDVWKKVWTRFGPSARVFNVTKLFTLQSLQKVEHVLNCLSSWRRILEQKSWRMLKEYVLVKEGNQRKYVSIMADIGKQRLLQPSRLVGEEHAGDFVNLTQNAFNISEPPPSVHLDSFRRDYAKQAADANAYKTIDLKNILERLLHQKEESVSDYPSDYVRTSITREFQLYN